MVQEARQLWCKNPWIWIVFRKWPQIIFYQSHSIGIKNEITPTFTYSKSLKTPEKVLKIVCLLLICFLQIASKNAVVDKIAYSIATSWLSLNLWPCRALDMISSSTAVPEQCDHLWNCSLPAPLQLCTQSRQGCNATPQVHFSAVVRCKRSLTHGDWERDAMFVVEIFCQIGRI